MLLQQSLFPDAFEVQTRAMVALERLDLEEALRCVEEARARDPGLVNLETMAAAIRWLRAELGAGPIADELLADAFAIVPEDCRSGRIERATGDWIDRVIARWWLERNGRARGFVGEGRRLHCGALLLVLGKAGDALPLLRESLAAGLDERAELWGYFADACVACERLEEANGGYVRALLLSAREADLHRLRHPRLAALLDELRSAHAEDEARELLLTHAWLEGTLTIPPENGWLEGHLSRLQLASPPRASPSAEQRFRRFALLLYLDRSLPRGTYDEGRREEMQALSPELFERFLSRVRDSERRQTIPMRW